MVHSCKAEHHDGGHCRQIPMFPEFLPRLREVFERAEAGTKCAITSYRDTNQNLRTRLDKIIKRAGSGPG